MAKIDEDLSQIYTSRDFIKIYPAYMKSFQQRQREKINRTNFSDRPLSDDIVEFNVEYASLAEIKMRNIYIDGSLAQFH